MPRYCSICAHAKTAEITKSLTAGDSIRTVASRFGVTPAAAGRHLRGCLRTERRAKESGHHEGKISASGSARFESTRGEITSPRDLLSRLSTLFRLGDLLEEAYEKRDIDACVKLAREYRAAAESYAKVAGWLVEGASNTTIDARKQTFQVLANLSEIELRRLVAAPAIEAESTLVDITDNKALSDGS